MTMSNDSVRELQGLYGPFTVAERVVQKIWLRRDFEPEGTRLTDGRTLEIRSPGTWNLLGGPDFRAARLAIAGVPVTGDVEVHFHSSDWRAHRHAEDPLYDNVMLHVVMFPLAADEPAALDHRGREIPTLVLLPLLYRGLEEYAADDAIERMTARDTIEKIAELARMPRMERDEMLAGHARQRWELRKRFAGVRLRKLGWEQALHQTALEILGYRRNRVTMLDLASRHPLVDWRLDGEVARFYEEFRGKWQLQGLRPANHPLTRLRQYRQWVALKPTWPEDLRSFAANLSPGSENRSTSETRKQAGMGGLRNEFPEMTAGTVTGSRLDTLICDGFLPLLAADSKADPYALWFHWFLGDVPDEVKKALVVLGAAGTKAQPFCHGCAQGFLGWLAERESRASC